MDKVVIFGAGDMAQVFAFYLEKYSNLQVVAFTVDQAYLQEPSFCGRPVVAWEEIDAHYPPDAVRLLGPATYKRINEVRRERYLQARERGYSFANFIHPHNYINTEDIGENVVILENNAIQPFTRIGNNVIIWSTNHIGHHTVIEDHCFLASQVGIGGSARIGAGCYIGGQVGIIHGLKIGADSVISNGAFIASDVPENSVVIGEETPRRKITSDRIKHLF